ncbi:MAG: hypothetical protein JRE21_04450 [Deltaproteobacteria bacterium]|jgi:hypothetical protein|nr:hypothetical protein [Deltaproteobacteria bacterium]
MNTESQKAIERLKDLKKARERLLSLPPDAVLEHLTSEKGAVAIVHSFPPQDFHLLVRDIGAEDALPLLAMASNRQWEYLLDIEVWQKDRLDFSAATNWMNLLLSADPARMAEWCARENEAFLEFFLLNNIELKIREYDESPSEMGNDFITFDDTFYFRILDPPFFPETDTDEKSVSHGKQYLENRRNFLTQLLQRLSNADHPRLQNLLLESAAMIPAETEEELFRLRNVRLAEKGFLPFDEAVGVYQPLTEKNLKRRIRKLQTDPAADDNVMPVPHWAQNLLEPDNVFAKALTSIRNENSLMRLQSEFAGLCNQLLIADQKAVNGRSGLHDAVKKAYGYIGIGLEALSGSKIEQIEHYLLADIFRVGYGMALQLKWRANKWRNESWFMAQGLPLSFWDEEWLGVIGGLLIKRPLYFDNYQTGTLYREFSSPRDISVTDTTLTEIIAFDRLLATLSLSAKPVPPGSLLTYKNFILTHWAKETIDSGIHESVLSPLPLDAFKSFFDTLWRSPDKPRSIRLSVKSDFLKWLTEKSGLTGAQIVEQCGSILEDLFADIESELGQVLKKDIDPRYIQLFLIS